MSGLDPETEVILEIATLVTDADLKVLAEGPNIAIHHPPAVLANMEEWSRTHHTASGLMERVRASDIDLQAAEEKTMAFLRNYCEPATSPLCGNSVWQDRRFLIRHMPRLEAFFHYRNIDVSTIKELVRLWYPKLPSYRKEKAHLALSDIRESLKELRYYRETVFRSP
jgi:oligoribonuclease